MRLVARNRGDGEIARVLSISAATVKAHVKNARAKAGGLGRYELANAIAEEEGRTPSLATHEKRIELPPSVVPHALVSSGETQWQAGSSLHEERAVFGVGDDSISCLLAAQGRIRNDLSTAERLTRIGTMAFHLIAGLATLAVAMYLLQRLILSR